MFDLCNPTSNHSRCVYILTSTCTTRWPCIQTSNWLYHVVMSNRLDECPIQPVVHSYRPVAKRGGQGRPCTPVKPECPPPAWGGDCSVAMPPNRSIGLFTKNWAFYGLQICQKCFGGQGSALDPTTGAHNAPPDLLLKGGPKGGHAPKPWIKKLKLSCRGAGPDLAGGGPGAQLTWGH